MGKRSPVCGHSDSPNVHSNSNREKSTSNTVGGIAQGCSFEQRQRQPPLWQAYEDLLNKNQDDLYDVRLEDSQLGISRWTAKEKAIFFNALDRKGRSDIIGIATVIGSKSEAEVSAYLNLLEDTLREIYLNGDTEGWLLPLEDMPAAYEISQECCEALEEVSLAPEDDQDIIQGTESDALETSMGLLQQDTLNDLPADLFMNCSIPDYDWRSYSTSNNPPSVQARALDTLNAHIIDITRRLVSCALFLAASRINATTRSDRTPRSIVRSEDVEAVARIMGMKETSRDFWIFLAHRNGLQVYNESRGEGAGDGILPLQEVERRLQRPGNLRTIDDDMASDSEGPARSTSSDDRFENTSATQSSPSTQEDADEETGDASGTLPSSETLDSLDIHIEHLDMMASHQEEMRLWELLGRDPPNRITDEPIADRLAANDLTREPLLWNDQRDWRQHIVYVPAWATHGGFGNHKPGDGKNSGSWA